MLMGNHFFVLYFIAFLGCQFILQPVEAQNVTDDNLLVKNLLEKEFKAADLHYKDSALVNENLRNLKRYAEIHNDSALIFADRALVLAAEAGLISKVSIVLEEKGQFLMKKEDFGGAISCFLNALRIEEKINNQKRTADLNDLLGTIYFYQEIFGKALAYGEKAIAIYQDLKDTLNMAKALRHLGSLHLSREYCENRTAEQIQKDCQVAMDYYNRSLDLYKQKGDHQGIASMNTNIGMAYNRMGKPEIALGFVDKSLSYYRLNNNAQELSITLFNISKIYNRLLKFDQALLCLKEANEICEQVHQTEGIQFLYEVMAQTYYNLKDYKNSRDFYVKYMIVRDSVYNNEKSKQIFELETKYQTEKKQREIDRLTYVKQQRTQVIYILIVTIFIVFLVGWMYFRNITNRRIIADQQLEIKEQQLLELEKERQLTAAKSVLQGEEAERARLAGDLHDGLGGLLTGVKFKLSSMKENAIITSENLKNFNHALNLLDTSITELRRVAHNMMPETLMHFGLKTALMDFIHQVSPDGLPILRFSTFGVDLRFGKELEVTIYRITQELITNAIKHSQANNIDIQLFTEPDRICVQVVDDGVGFDPEKLDPTKKGHGLKNIQDRATAFNGRFELFSRPGKGSESTIEFLIP
jgi:signal transduction histidine kinase